MDEKITHAITRFGYGFLAGDSLPPDPVAWLSAQVTGPDTPSAAVAALPSTAAILAAQAGGKQTEQDSYNTDSSTQTNGVIFSKAPFRERLVNLWANHITTAVNAEGVTGIAGAYVREAIRPHVTGKFSDMLMAAMQHPAMLTYLTNTENIGPNSPYGKQTGLGGNENLGRECMSLFTITPASGFTQADVTAMSMILTGWTVENDQFAFDASRHEPGTKTLMGNVYPEGQQGGIEALTWLAAHPFTYQNLALRLARHFVADSPSQDTLNAIASVLQSTGGDLGQAALAVVNLPEAWTPLAKLRTPYDYMIAIARASGGTNVAGFAATWVMLTLGQELWDAPAPNGWPDVAGPWMAPESMMDRIDWAWNLAGAVVSSQPTIDPIQVAQSVLGPLMSTKTAAYIAAAAWNVEGLARLFSSPEFQRR